MKELTPVISGKQVFLFVAVATTWQGGGGGGGNIQAGQPSPASRSQGILQPSASTGHGCSAASRGPRCSSESSSAQPGAPSGGVHLGDGGWSLRGGAGWKPGAGTLQP